MQLSGSTPQLLSLIPRYGYFSGWVIESHGKRMLRLKKGFDPDPQLDPQEALLCKASVVFGAPPGFQFIENTSERETVTAVVQHFLPIKPTCCASSDLLNTTAASGFINCC